MGVFAQRFAADGTPEGSEFRVNVNEDGEQYYPSIAMLPGGGFAIGFHESDIDNRDFEIKTRVFDADGQGAPEFQLNEYTDAYQRMVRIAPSPAGFVAVWESFAQDGDAYGIFSRHYDLEQGLGEMEFQVNDSGTGWQAAPAVAAAGDGRYIVAWHFMNGQGIYEIRTRPLGGH